MRTRPLPPVKNWEKLEPHPYNEILEVGDVTGLANHMQEFGYDDNEPIILFEGKILSGRRRHAAAIQAEVIDPPFREFIDSDPIAWCQKEALRRNLTPSQLAMLGAELHKFRVGRPKVENKDDKVDVKHDESQLPLENTEKKSPHLCGVSPSKRDDVAANLGISTSQLDKAIKLSRNASPKLQRMVRIGKISVDDALKIQSLSFSKQEAAIDKLIAHPKAYGSVAEAAGVKEGVSKPKKERKKKSDVGKPIFDWRDFDARVGSIARGVDDIAHAYSKEGVDETKSLGHRECIRVLNEFREKLTKWRERLLNETPKPS